LVSEQLNSTITLIVPIVTAGIAIAGTRWIVSKYQKQKDEGEIRKEVLRNYISFKNYVVMMDNFVGELVMMYGRFDNFVAKNDTGLSELLPWVYTYDNLDHYSGKMEFGDLRNFKNEKYQIKQEFDTLRAVTKCGIDFQDPPSKKFGSQFSNFQHKFYERSAALEFEALVSQYYKNSEKLLDNFSGMWEYTMGCSALIKRIMCATEKNDFVEKIKKYNEASHFLFDCSKAFEEKLVGDTISFSRKRRAIAPPLKSM
jgi:hypothetical protein